MKTILITGGIASGKSEARCYLESLGYPAYDCDSRTKALYDEIPGLKAKVEEAIGLPFSQIGVIFRDSAKREALEAVVYPEVLADIRRWKSALGDVPFCFMESAIALEKPLFDAEYDEVWMLRSPLEERLARNPLAAERIGAQNPDYSRADVTILNDSDIASLHDKIDNLLKDR